ncbi:hypothetical protein KPH14_009049 [Odynerus spinipes]|uniref:Trans-1,2-dihydrobenzene-1,2-diol dehydrogenase n=1 Tax=Odynerus spinipes TaxID=1348599 RepID=A0AAD9RNJ8_9HYME|nr:hypothetical protein KPH14_009049 [Odynerus spinipes]
MATRWGIAGAGKISHDFVTAMASLPKEEHEVIGVAARDLSRAQAFAKLHDIKNAYNDYAELAKNKDIEVVYIGTLNPQHFEIAKLMLSHGKHVLCEKPLTMNLKQTRELIQFARSKNLFLMEGIWSRFFPAYDAIREEIASGSLGEIHQIIVSFGFNMPDVERLKMKSLGGGTILDLGVYVLQLACMVFNNEMPHTIKASGCLNEEGVDISTSTTLQYKGNRTATVLTHSLVDMPNEAYISGTKGTIHVPCFWCPPKVNLPRGTLHKPLPDPKHKLNFINSTGLSYEAAAVRTCLQKGMIEHPHMSHDTSILLATLEDELRKQIGVVYPED